MYVDLGGKGDDGVIIVLLVMQEFFPLFCRNQCLFCKVIGFFLLIGCIIFCRLIINKPGLMVMNQVKENMAKFMELNPISSKYYPNLIAGIFIGPDNGI